MCIVQKGQLRPKSLTENQTEIKWKMSSCSPTERQSIIENSLKNVSYNQDPVLKHFSIKVEENMISVPARVLDQPLLEYAQNKVNCYYIYLFQISRNNIFRTNYNVTNVMWKIDLKKCNLIFWNNIHLAYLHFHPIKFSLIIYKIYKIMGVSFTPLIMYIKHGFFYSSYYLMLGKNYFKIIYFT